MIRLTLLLLFINSNLAITASLTQYCNCEQIKSKLDCVFNSCLWKDEKCFKNEVDLSDETVSVYCNSLNKTSCQSQKGCALNKELCEQFSGCSAYIEGSNDLCQQISQQCTSDGTQCIELLDCPEYLDKFLCNSNINVQGRKCKWEENKCRNLKCIDASTTLSTDYQCNMFFTGCVTNGKGCVEIRQECSTYGDSCVGMIGSDGYCEKTSNGCNSVLCSAASVELTTNEQCEKFQFGCVTTGRGCSKYPLNSCTTYTAEVSICQLMIGSEGKCDGGVNNQCQERKCENASKTNNTDQLCQLYLSTCITNGRGCVSQLKLCNTYTGTIVECDHYIGSDGRCTLGQNGCKVRVCNEAPDTINQIIKFIRFFVKQIMIIYIIILYSQQWTIEFKNTNYYLQKILTNDKLFYQYKYFNFHNLKLKEYLTVLSKQILSAKIINMDAQRLVWVVVIKDSLVLLIQYFQIYQQ